MLDDLAFGMGGPGGDGIVSAGEAPTAAAFEGLAGMRIVPRLLDLPRPRAGRARSEVSALTCGDEPVFRAGNVQTEVRR